LLKKSTHQNRAYATIAGKGRGLSAPKNALFWRAQLFFYSLFDLENRYASLSKTGDPLERLKVLSDERL
jgi:hypothetical protein